MSTNLIIGTLDSCKLYATPVGPQAEILQLETVDLTAFIRSYLV